MTYGIFSCWGWMEGRGLWCYGAGQPCPSGPILQLVNDIVKQFFCHSFHKWWCCLVQKKLYSLPYVMKCYWILKNKRMEFKCNVLQSTMLCFIDSKVQQRGNLHHQHLMYEQQDLHHFWDCFHVTRDESHFCMQPAPRFIHTRLILDLAPKQVSYKFPSSFI